MNISFFRTLYKQKQIKMNAIATTLLVVSTSSAASSATSPGGYVIGAIISLLIMVYLIYSLIKPEKF
jgi:K+-transporting ATPase KdpF subunit